MTKNILGAIGEQIEYQTEKTHKLGESYSSFFFESRPTTTAFSRDSLVIETDEDSGKNQSAELQYEVCETAESLGRNLGISAQVSASIFGVNVEGSASYAASKEFTANSFVVVIKAKCYTKTERLDPAQLALTAEAKKILEQENGPELFTFTYGDYFCSERLFGGELFIFLRVTSSSISEKEKVAAAVKAAWEGGQAEANFAAEFQKQTKNSQKSYKVSVNGKLEVPESEDLDKLLEYARKFCQSLGHGSNVVRITYSPFIHTTGAGIPELMQKLGKYLRKPSDNLDELIEWVTGYRELLNRIEQVLEDQAFYGLSDYEAATLEAIKENMDSHSDELKKERKSKAQFPHEIRNPRDILTAEKHPDQYKKKIEGMNLEKKLHVQSGQPVYLRDMYGKFICTIMRDHEEHPFPGTVGTRAMLTLNTGGSSYLESGDTVKICTTESTLDKKPLGKFSDHHWLYWSTYKGEANGQDWVIRKEDGTKGPIRYGDKVFLENTAKESKPHRIAAAYKEQTPYLLAREPGKEYDWRWWIIERAQ